MIVAVKVIILIIILSLPLFFMILKNIFRLLSPLSSLPSSPKEQYISTFFSFFKKFLFATSVYHSPWIHLPFIIQRSSVVRREGSMPVVLRRSFSCCSPSRPFPYPPDFLSILPSSHSPILRSSPPPTSLLPPCLPLEHGTGM